MPLDLAEIKRKAMPLANQLTAVVDKEDIDPITAVVALLSAAGPLLYSLPRENQMQLGFIAMAMIAGATGDMPPPDIFKEE